jgi:hypothetical protein
VSWAYQLCNKTQIDPTHNLRRVVWIRKPSLEPVSIKLTELLGPYDAVLVAVLNFHDKVCGRLTTSSDIMPLTLELEFLKGHKIP